MITATHVTDDDTDQADHFLTALLLGLVFYTVYLGSSVVNKIRYARHRLTMRKRS